MNALLQFLFPPVCKACKEVCATKWFCPDCWTLCQLPDPMERCRHCFEELEGWEHLCQTCRKKKKLPIPRAYVFDPTSPAAFLNQEAIEALAGFAFWQWVQLDWPKPDAIIPMPGTFPTASVFASLMECPLVQALSSSLEYREERLEDHQILLLFCVQSSLEDQEKAALSLMQAFPKRSYLLTLFAYVDHPT